MILCGTHQYSGSAVESKSESKCSMKHFAALVVLLCVVAAPAFAEGWTGFLVDAKCYASEETNVGPFDLPFYLTRRGDEIPACRPGRKTKIYAIVDLDGYTFEIDSSENAKAADVVRKAANRHVLRVRITGEEVNKKLKIDTITLEN